MRWIRTTLSLSLMLLSLSTCSTVPQSAQQTTAPALVPGVILGDRQRSTLPLVAERQERIAAALAAPPYMLRRDNLEPNLAMAQDAAVHDERIQAATRSSTGERLRAEVLTVGAARAGDLPPEQVAACAAETCTRVVMYVYPTNTTVTAIVAAEGTVLAVQSLVGAQPEMPDDLAALATQIALNDPQLAAAFDGLSPEAAMAAMSATKTALEGTACERSQHLCVAPVFVWGDTALWTIVDLTEFTLVAATTWTELGSSGRRVYSEATLQDTAVAPLCETAQRFEHAGWQATYLLTSSDGLELRDVTYKGRPILQSVKVVDWHVSYTGSNDQRVGFSDAVGCPVFSAAAVIPYGPPEMRTNATGDQTLHITFRSPNWPQPCNYQYSFSAQFGGDGTLHLNLANEGRGCGIGGIYHPIVRLEPPSGTLSLVKSTADSVISHEGQEEWAAGADNRFRVANADGALELAPTWGNAELAYVYWTHAKPEEGQGDLPSIGQCCALDAQQGPEQFIGPGAPEALADHVVLWFVPRLSNAEREHCWADTTLINGNLEPEVWPCTAGIVVTGSE